MQYSAWVRQPFSYDTTTADINSPYTDDIIELQESEVKKRDFNTTNLQTFWCQQIEGYSLIAKVAFEVLMPFVTTYLFEHVFSILVDVKAKRTVFLTGLHAKMKELLFPSQSLKFYN